MGKGKTKRKKARPRTAEGRMAARSTSYREGGRERKKPQACLFDEEEKEKDMRSWASAVYEIDRESRKREYAKKKIG